MLNLKQILLSVLIISFTSLIIADEQQLTTLSEETTNNKYTLTAITYDNFELRELCLYIDHPNSEKTNISCHPATHNDLDKGIILLELYGYPILKLTSHNFSPYNGGVAVLEYLYNGFLGEKKELNFELTSLNNHWGIYIANGDKIKHAHAISNKFFFFGAIGIKRLEFTI